MPDFKLRFVTTIIRTVITLYAVWMTVLIIDFLLCTKKGDTNCEAARAELRGAAMSIPATLLAWLAESPSQAQ